MNKDTLLKCIYAIIAIIVGIISIPIVLALSHIVLIILSILFMLLAFLANAFVPSILAALTFIVIVEAMYRLFPHKDEED